MSNSHLVVDGGPPRRSNLTIFPCAIFVIAGVSALGFLLWFLGRATETPPRPLPPKHVLAFMGFGVGTLLVIGTLLLVGSIADHHRALARSGRVEFRDAVIFFAKGDQKVGVRWSDVSGFIDVAPDFVQIVATTSPYPSRLLTVPTPTERERVAVLEHLDRRGLRRLG